MRLKSVELMFIVCAMLSAIAAGLLYYAISLNSTFELSEIEKAAHGAVNNVLYISMALTSVSLTLAVFMIFPQIRNQTKEQSRLQDMTERLSARSDNMEQVALTDGLTGLQNRRYFDDALAQYLDEFKRIQKPVGLIVLDLDHFKMVNDTHGHDVGDEVLRQVSQCLKNFTRFHDIAARLGGEEFAVVAPNMDADSLTKFAERIRRAVADLVIVSGNVHLKVTTSVGLTIWDGVEDPDSFYRRADRMLYQAKRQGRNRVCAA
jgi:two-component system, cell cycle response regulator